LSFPILSISYDPKFDIKDLGDLLLFSWYGGHQDSSGLTLTQSKYAIDLLKRSNMAAAKPSPMHTKMILGLYWAP
jgi:hypothetical protein